MDETTLRELRGLAKQRRTVEARLQQRALVVLLAAEGRQNKDIAIEAGLDRRQVAMWRGRFLAGGIDALRKDAPRSGRPATITAEIESRIVHATLHDKPVNATHWSTRTLAEHLGVGATTIRRVWQSNGLKPHRPLHAKHLSLHLVVDNYATHSHPEVQKWLATHPRFVMHFTPTSASWLNMVERFFRDISDKRIRRDSFTSIAELELAIDLYVAHHNIDPKPFIWTTSAKDILAKVTRAKAAFTAAPG